MINDISALRMDRNMARTAAVAGCPVCLMHMQGVPRNMQKDPRYDKDPVGEIIAFLEERIAAALESGIQEHNIIIDPGIGFGKTAEHNLEIMNRLDEFRVLGRPVLLGASRKRFIGAALNQPDEADRLHGSLAVAALAAARGADIVRVHDVPETVNAVRMADAICRKTRSARIRGT
jgi:dihydropteroate synthase